ncbi:MAG TPA: RNA-guided endonuclease TnpB family protein [Trebonia sp.]
MRTAYRCRAYPDDAQQVMLSRTFGCVRVVWNRTLAARHARYGRQTAHYTRSAFRVKNGELWLAKSSTPLKFTWSWPEVDFAALNPSTVIIARESDGRWYVTFTVDTDEPGPLPETDRATGVDLGVKDFAALSTGGKIANPRHLERKARNLARYQRRLARTQKGSANRVKARAKVARAHRKVSDARKDFLHKTSTRLVRENDLIAIEDLNVNGMTRRPKPKPDGKGGHQRNGAAAKAGLSKSVLDAGFGEFRRQLEYKTERYGRTLIVIDRWYPSSKTCSACGHLPESPPLRARAADKVVFPDRGLRRSDGAGGWREFSPFVRAEVGRLGGWQGRRLRRVVTDSRLRAGMVPGQGGD